jgi:hypothetical protein
MYPTTILELHSLVRWLLVGVALIGVVWYGLTWAGRLANARAERALMLAFTIALDIQVLLGIIHLLELIGAGIAGREQYEHTVIMLVAVGVAHVVQRRFKNAEPRIRARNYLFGIVAVLILVFIGVWLLPAIGLTNRWGIPVS